MEKTTDEMIQTAVDKMSQEFPNEDKSKYVAILNQVIKEGVFPQEAMGFSDEFIEMLYAYAYKLFQSGKFAEAATTYRFLMSMCPWDIRHPLGLGACYHHNKEYTKALTTYITSSYVQPYNPMPLYYASNCFLKLDQLQGAIEMLKLVLTRCANVAEYRELKDKTELLLQGLQKQLEEQQVTKKE